jgi:hypothetical protein
MDLTDAEPERPTRVRPSPDLHHRHPRVGRVGRVGQITLLTFDRLHPSGSYGAWSAACVLLTEGEVAQ